MVTLPKIKNFSLFKTRHFYKTTLCTQIINIVPSKTQILSYYKAIKPK